MTTTKSHTGSPTPTTETRPSSAATRCDMVGPGTRGLGVGGGGGGGRGGRGGEGGREGEGVHATSHPPSPPPYDVTQITRAPRQTYRPSAHVAFWGRNFIHDYISFFVCVFYVIYNICCVYVHSLTVH